MQLIDTKNELLVETSNNDIVSTNINSSDSSNTNTIMNINRNTTQKRYFSIDFLRGLAIVFMLILHIISDTLNIEYYIANLSNVVIINIFALIIMPFLGGLAGLFLLVSSIANAISIRRNLTTTRERIATPPKLVALKQIVGGFIIVIFGMFSEAFLGYHGAIGEIMLNLDRLDSVNINSWRYIAYLFETLHAIGWCTLLNGVVLGTLFVKYNPRDNINLEKIIHIYWGLIPCVLFLTPIIWALISLIIPGYPFEINTNTQNAYYLPTTGISPFKDFVIYFFINPLAAPVEPVFPYLATAFLGTIIGFKLTDATNHEANNNNGPSSVTTSFVTKYLWVATIAFLVGVTGLLGLFLRMNDFDAALDMYTKIYNHRLYVASNGLPFGWLFQYLALNGFSFALTMLTIRLFEARGPDAVHDLASNSVFTFIRRFGFIAFTVYVIQWVYSAIHFIVSAAYPGVDYYGKLPWLGSWIIVIITFVILHVLMRIWEGYGYVGSMEWAILSVANFILPVKKQAGISSLSTSTSSNQAIRWWQRGKLNVSGAFYEPEWLAFSICSDDISQEIAALDEHILIKKLFFVGFIFPPFFFIDVWLCRSLERKNVRPGLINIRLWKILSIAGVWVFIILFISLCSASLSAFGIKL